MDSRRAAIDPGKLLEPRDVPIDQDHVHEYVGRAGHGRKRKDPDNRGLKSTEFHRQGHPETPADPGNATTTKGDEFDFVTNQIEIKLPDYEQRVDIFKVILKNESLDRSITELTYESLAKMSDGFSGSSIKDVCQDAVTTAIYNFKTQSKLVAT